MLIYRGVDEKTDLMLSGRLTPKGDQSNWEFTADTTYVTACNAEVTVDSSSVNAAYAHQSDFIKTEETAWVSCSPNYEVAKIFATLNGLVDGYIYEIDTDKFERYEVTMLGPLKSAPEKGEEEISIRSLNGGSIPTEVIINKHQIKV